MQSIIIADTSCLIALSKINRIEILNEIFGKIYVTQIVAEEFKKKLPENFSIKNPSDISTEKLKGIKIDRGEASAIALALEEKNPLLIIDEKKGRIIAKHFGIRIMGTVGVLLEAKKDGLIESLKTEIEKLQEHSRFRLSDALIKEALKNANEK